MRHQVIKRARTLHCESYALLKQSENRCFLHVQQVLFLNWYKFYFLLLPPKFTLKLKLQLWTMPPGMKLRARFYELSWMDSKTNWFPLGKYLKLLMAVGLKEREEEQQLNEWLQQRYFRFRPDRRTHQACLTLFWTAWMLECHSNSGLWLCFDARLSL